MIPWFIPKLRSKTSGIFDLETQKSNAVYSGNLANWLCGIFDKDLLVNDFGCGMGYYVEKLLSKGFNAVGFEGTKDINSISVVPVVSLNLSLSFHVNKGQVLCLEVGEHIPSKYEEQFVNNLIEHAQGIKVISWAIRGQFGHGHVNCKNGDEVLKLFPWKINADLTAQGRALDFGVCNWFKNTLFVFD
jgi:hypothetical protein